MVWHSTAGAYGLGRPCFGLAQGRAAHGAFAERSDRAEEPQAHFSDVFMRRLEGGTATRLEAMLRMPKLAGDDEDGVQGRWFVQLWVDGADEAVILGLGDRYTPTPPADPDGAALLVIQNAGLLLAGATASGNVTLHQPKGSQREESDLPFPWPVIGLFTRLRRSTLLDHKTRRAVYDAIEANPGLRFGELRAETGLAVGVLTHHLRMLEAHGLIASERRGRHRYLYPHAGTPRAQHPRVTDRQEEILRTVASGPRTQNEIAARLGISQQAVSYHLGPLVEAGRLRRHRGPSGAWVYSVGGADAGPVTD
jgi:DNA-binding transcriptional ArsR family regulator